MAVRVVAPPPDARTISCSGCGFVLEYLPKDIRTYTDEYEPEIFRYIRCPRNECPRNECLTMTTIPDPPEDYY